MSEDARSKSEDLWTPYKELYQTINYHLCGDANRDGNTVEFENALRKHKQNFLALLQNPPKSPKSRDELKKGMEDGITIKGIGHQVLSRDLYDETIILSDMYDMNEFVALDLLCTAQMQMPYHYGLPRGLVAVLLYYEGRKLLVASLRLLVQARRGVSWTMDLKPELISFVTAYTDRLLHGGLFDRILELLKDLDLSRELEKLRENVALGGPKHRRQIVNHFDDVRQILAEIVFLWSAQSGLPREPTVRLLGFLRQLTVEEDAAGRINNTSFYLLAAMLFAIDLSVLHIREDAEDLVRALPMVADKGYLEMLFGELSPTKPKWNNEGLQGVVTFGLAVTAACLRLLPQCLELQVAADKEVTFLCAAIEMKVFQFLNHKVLTKDALYEDEILTRRFHYLFTDFIVQMFAKVKELRIKADETARTMQVYSHEGLEPPPNLPRHFEDFTECLARFYAKDPLNLQYCLEFWCPVDGGGAPAHESYSYRAPPRSVSLFKFVRLAGDLVPVTLFVPFLDMLSSLSSCPQAARNCFNMLKQSTGAGFNSTVSWDHFFTSFSQYYGNLRQETPPFADTVYYRSGGGAGGGHYRGITPQETAGLHAVLRLIRVVAEQDDFSRLALCEHPGWAPLTVLLGLVGCAVPVPLKADLLLTLAALSRSPETAAQTWANMEASQVLVTVPTTSSYQPRGIQTELEEVESRNEEYPLTRALLTLLDVLTDCGIPRMLGAGPRKPGFHPYLNFVVGSVFLRSSTRAYRDPEERWIVRSLCLKMFEKFLNQYEPQPADFAADGDENKKGGAAVGGPHPGFHILVQLNVKSEFLNLILCMVEEGERLFRQYASFAGQRHVEECTLRCLNVLERALRLQAGFFRLLSASASPLILTGLGKLLLIINPRTGRPDHCLNVSRYLCYRRTLPKHAAAAVKILLHVTALPASHSQYLNILLADEAEANVIRTGFVEALDAPAGEEATKEAILRLLRQCLAYAAPNLAHFLFGFDTRRDISQTLFQHPGVLGFPRTCLHSVLAVLRQAAVTRGTAVCRHADSLLELAYGTLYLLCANHRTSEPVLRFVRQSPDFFERQLRARAETANESAARLNQLSWLLKTVAIELKVACARSKISQLREMTRLLVGVPEDLDGGNIPSDTFSIIRQHHRGGNVDADDAEDRGATEKLLVKLVARFDFGAVDVLAPRWNYFDAEVLDALLRACEVDAGGARLIDVRKLHHTLVDEIGTLQANTAVGQRHAVLQEIQKVLEHALHVNNVRNSVAAVIAFADSWRQIVEVVALYVPYEALSPPEQQQLSVCLVENVCRKVAETSSRLPPEVGSRLSGTVLHLMENVLRCQVQVATRAVERKEPVPSVVQAHAASFRITLHRILLWLLGSDAAAQGLRINLYASLVTFLKLVRLEESTPSPSQPPDGGVGEFYVFRLDTSRVQGVSGRGAVSCIPSDAFSVFGEKLMEVVCHDCIGGHEVGKMLAMSTLGTLVDMTGDNNWIVYMSGRGYTKHIVDGVLGSDAELCGLLEPAPPTLKPLYLYLSKLTLLARLASTRVGAELLLEQRLLPSLGNMNVYSAHPEVPKGGRPQQETEEEIDGFLPSRAARYLQLFLPTLRLCNAIVTSLGTENRSAVSQILSYLAGNVDVLEYVLRSGSPTLPVDFLEELSCVTSILARIASADATLPTQHVENIQDYRAYLLRVQKHMLALLPVFLLTETVMRNPSTEQERRHYILQIVANLLMYARNSGGGVCATLFRPALGDSLMGFEGKRRGRIEHADQSPIIGTIVQHLVNVVGYRCDRRGSFGCPPSELEHCAFITEHCLYLIWSHLDYYMLKAIPATTMRFGDTSAINFEDTLASASEATWKVSTDDVCNLKHGLAAILNDSFCRNILETVQGSSSSDTSRQFTETLLRKIKRLIQFVPVK